MNIKTTLFVAVIAAALAAYFLLVETKTTTTLEKERQQAQQGDDVGQRVFTAEQFPISKIATVRIERPGQSPVVLSKSDESWRQTEPIAFALQGHMVEDLVDHAGTLRYTSKFTPTQRGVTLDTLGLAEPDVKLTFSGDDVEPVTVTIGKRATAGRAYLTLEKPSDSATVYVVNDQLHQTAAKNTVRAMRARSLADFSPGQARRIMLTRGGKTIEVTQQNGSWTITQPTPGRASLGGARKLVEALTKANVAAFVADQPDDLAPFGLDQPAAVLTMQVAEQVSAPAASADGEQPAESEDKLVTHTLKIGSATDLGGEQHFAMLDGVDTVFTLNKSAVDKLNIDLAALRDASLTPIARGDVREIKLQRKNQPSLHLLKDPAWAFGEPKPDFRLEGEVVPMLLDAIFKTQATDYQPLENVKLAEPIATIELYAIAKDKPETLRVHEHGEDQLMVVRGDESTGYLVPRDALNLALAPPIAYRDRTVLDLASDQIQALHISRTGQHPAEYTIQREGEKWQLDGYNDAAVQSVVNHLTPLRATGWVTEPMATIPEGVNVKITLAEGKPRTLSVKGGLGQVDGVDTQFHVSKSLIQALNTELRDTLVLDVAAGQIAKVQIGERTVYRDDDGNYSMTGPGELAEPAAAAIWDHLAKLSAEHFVDAGRASGEPTATLAITTRDEKTHTLKLWQLDGQSAVAQLGDKTFTLGVEAAKSLTTPPIKTAPAEGGK